MLHDLVQIINKTKVLVSITLMVSAMLHAADYGEGVAKYSTVQLPDEPAVNTTDYYPETDDAMGINVAIVKANTAGGGTVRLEAKTYLISTTIVLRDNVRVYGKGMDSTILKRSPDFSGVGTTNYLMGAENGTVNDAEIRGLTLDGDYSPAELEASERLLGIFFNSLNGYNERIRIQYVEVKGFGMGIHMKGTTHVIIQHCDLHHNGGNYLYHNVYFRRVGQALFYKNTIYDAVAGSGLKLAGGTSTVPNESRYFTIMENNIYNNERINLNIQGCNDMLIEGNSLNSQNSTTSKMAGVYMVAYNDYTCDNTDIINNVVKDNTNNGFYVKGCRSFNIEGNACYDNGKNYNLLSNTNFFCDYNTSSEVTGIDQIWREKGNKVQIYPNPVSNTLYLSSEFDFVIQLFNMAGKSVYQSIDSKEVHKIDMSDMEDGIYMAQTLQNGLVKTYKICKN